MIPRSYTLIFSVALLSSMLFVSFFPLMDNADCKEEDMPPRANEGVVERDFDVQFMIEPSSDILSQHYGEKYVHLEPGSMADIRILITNIGSFNDTYTLCVDDPPQDMGWNWYFTDSKEGSETFNLSSPHQTDIHGGRSFRTFILHVLCPADGLGPILINISCESKYWSEMENLNRSRDYDEITIIPSHSGGLSIFTPLPRLYYVEPFESIEIPFFLSSLGTRDVIEIDVFLVPDLFWMTSIRSFEEIYIAYDSLLYYNWTHMKVELNPGERIERNFSFYPDPHVFGPGDVWQFRYIGWYTNTSYWIYSDIITLIGGPSPNWTVNETEPEENEKVENHPPIPIISDPLPQVKYLETKDILLNGCFSSDPNGNNLTYLWYSDKDGYLGTEPVIMKKLSQQDHRISLHVSDGEFNISTSVKISVIPDPNAIDTDKDGIPDLYDNDDDNDRLLDIEEDRNRNGLWEPQIGETDSKVADTDGDGIDDYNDPSPLDTSPPPDEKDEVSIPVVIGIIVIFTTLMIVIIITGFIIFILIKKKTEKGPKD